MLQKEKILVSQQRTTKRLQGKASSKARMLKTDLSEIEKDIESLRREERLLGESISSAAKADRLFTLDTLGFTGGEAEKVMKERGLLLLKKPLRIDQILMEGPLSSKHLPHISRQERKKKLSLKLKSSSPSNIIKPLTSVDAWDLPSIANKQKRMVAPAVLQRKVPSVRVPLTSGESYQPKEDEYFSRLNEAANIEIQKESQRKSFIQPICTSVSNGDDVLEIEEDKEMEVAVAVAVAVEEVKGGENFKVSFNTKEKLERKKTRTERNKILLKKNKERSLIKAELEEKQRKQEHEVKSIGKKFKKEHQENEKILEEKIKQRKVLRQSERAVLQRLAKRPFERDLMPIQMPEDRTKTLRELKPEGNLLIERFKSMQERTLIESATPADELSRERRRMKRDLSFGRRDVEIRSFREFK